MKIRLRRQLQVPNSIRIFENTPLIQNYTLCLQKVLPCTLYLQIYPNGKALLSYTQAREAELVYCAHL